MNDEVIVVLGDVWPWLLPAGGGRVEPRPLHRPGQWLGRTLDLHGHKNRLILFSKSFSQLLHICSHIVFTQYLRRLTETKKNIFIFLKYFVFCLPPSLKPFVVSY